MKRSCILFGFMCTLLCKYVYGDAECHSCFTHCKTNKNGQIDSQRCDCIGEQMCLGRACFVKMEIFPGESTAIVQKGCVSDVPGDMEGCQYAGQYESVHCYCTGRLCNTREKLSNYNTRQLPTVECCECSEPHGDRCLEKKCLRQCRGNYCLIDFDGVEQGCGIGYSRLQSFLRTRNYANWQGHTTCARYQATESTLVHGCVCTNPTGSCNEMNKTRTFQVENVIERRKEDLIYCYSLHHKSKALIGQEVFKNSGTCEGQYCFISLTTSELMVESATFEENYEDHKEFIGISRPRYEILAGCLKVDDDKKVSVGCTTEFSRNLSEPLARHCICDSHLCNFYHLLTVDADTRKPIEDSRGEPNRSKGLMIVNLPSSNEAIATTTYFSTAIGISLIICLKMRLQIIN
uniref:Uncharacterized protein n=1 Tax=Parascaris univalens TaxID=6257 RepID=A0A915AF78_PARUN